MDFPYDKFPSILLDAVLQFVILSTFFFFLEKIQPAEPKTPFFKQGLGAEISFYFVNTVLLVPLLGVLFTNMSSAFIGPLIPYQAFNETIQEWPLLVQIVLGVLLLDACTYWRHRFTHMHMWRFHSIHHSAEQITWTTKSRLHPVDLATAAFFHIVVLHVFGFGGEGMGWSILVSQCIDSFAHANLDFGFKGPLRFVLGSPRYHRWHHANAKEAYDKNFAVAFPFIDLLFGTYHYPVDRLPKKYGLMGKDQKDCPNDFIGLVLHPFATIFRKSELKKRSL